MRRLFAGVLLAVLSLLGTGCSLASLKKPPYCPAEPAIRPVEAGKEGGPLFQKAVAYGEWAEKLWPAPYGGMVNTQFSSPAFDQVAGYSDLQDSTDWTGTYLAAEAFRYAVTSDPKARENAARAVRTLDFFLKATGRPGYIARFAGPLTTPYLCYLGGSCSEKMNLPCYSFTGPDGQPSFWLGDTTRDQYSGWFFGMGIAYRLIDDPELRSIIHADVKEVIDALESWGYVIQGPGGSKVGSGQRVEAIVQLSWNLIAADVLRDDPAYCARYEELVKKKLAEALSDNESGLNKYFQYYAFNLDFLTNYNLILLEPNAERKKAYLEAFHEGAYQFVKGTGNSFLDYIEMAASGTSDPQTLASDRQSLALFQPAPNVMRCVQPPPPARLSRASVLLSKINGFASHFGVKQEFFPQAAAPYPLNERCPVDFIWQQSPYTTCCFNNCPDSNVSPVCGQNQFQTNVVFPGADYLVAYWMGRYHGFLTPED